MPRALSWSCVRLLVLLAGSSWLSPESAAALGSSDSVSGAHPDSVAPPRWALVLSGGAARGFAHIGVLRALEEEGLRPDLVVGTSMGSLVGALWASGKTSSEIQETFRQVDFTSVFEPQPRSYEWRRVLLPRPWVTLVGRGRSLRLPPAMVDDSYLNYALARFLLVSEARAQGSFDRLPIRWRSIATDLSTLSPVPLSEGSVAQAVRASLSIPLLFPAQSRDGLLLLDGGLSSHMPVGVARREGMVHVLAVDVAITPPKLDEESSAFELGAALLESVTRRGQNDTLGPADRLVRLRMPGISPAAFALCDSISALGYRGAREVVRGLAEEWGLPRAPARPDTLTRLPPLREIAWRERSGRPAARSATARALYGRLPRGPFEPEALGPGLNRVYRGDLFLSAWPHLRSQGDSTTLTFVVKEHETWEATLAAEYDNDLHGRANLTLVARPLQGPWPAVLIAGGTVRQLGREVYAAAEPHSLARGSPGWFLRTGARRTETRIFGPDRSHEQVATERVELAAGGQLRSPMGEVLQVGLGWARAWSRGRSLDGPLAALRLEGGGHFPRLVDAVAIVGTDGYASVSTAFGIVLPTPLMAVRPSWTIGWASTEAPLDELHGLGGPSSMAGLRQDEWLGRRKLGFELRLTRDVVSGVEAHVAGQIGRIGEPVSRADLTGRARAAAGLGMRANLPLGPLSLDWGMSERGAQRIDFSLGAKF